MKLRNITMKLLSTFISLVAGSVACSSLTGVSAFAFTSTQHKTVSTQPGDVCQQQQHPRLCPRIVIDYGQSDRLRLRCTRLLSNTAVTDLSGSNSHTDSARTYYDHLLEQFQGDFDNYNQVVQDRKHGLTPGEGGGHENIHCTLVPCPQHTDVIVDEDTKKHRNTSQWVLAAFYFNGNPRQIFRFRVYQLIPPSSEDLPVRMKLNTLLPRLEQQLRQCSDQPGSWWKEVWNVWREEEGGEVLDSSTINSENWNQLRNVGMKTMVSPLEGCDVLWDPNWDPSKHAYLYVDEYNDGTSTPKVPSSMGQSYHATMEAGSKGAIVDSISLIPGKRILIKDELSLWNDEFWINDRGYDPDAVEGGNGKDDNKDDSESMPFVYGNRRGVPYKLQRVASFSSSSQDRNGNNESCLSFERAIDNTDLEWTLGEDYRTLELFEEKLQALDIK